MMTEEKTIKQPKKQSAASHFSLSVGRRKEAVARVRIYDGGSKVEVFGEERKRGDIIINKKPIAEYFRITSFAPKYKKILTDTGTYGKYIITARVTGGGLAGQLDAFIHGVARALDRMDPEKYHKMLREKGYLTRDPRTRERRRVGTGGKARRKKTKPKEVVFSDKVPLKLLLEQYSNSTEKAIKKIITKVRSRRSSKD